MNDYWVWQWKWFGFSSIDAGRGWDMYGAKWEFKKPLFEGRVDERSEDVEDISDLGTRNALIIAEKVSKLLDKDDINLVDLKDLASMNKQVWDGLIKSSAVSDVNRELELFRRRLKV